MQKIQLKYSLAIILSVLFFVFEANSEEKNLTIELGNKNAKITVKVFSSLTCPHCANFHEKIFYKLKKEFIETNVVRFEHHGFPLDLAALNAEKILKCSKNYAKRIDFLNEIYKKQNEWAVGSDINSINSKLIKIAENYDLNNVKINSCLNDEKLEDQILNDRINGNKKYSIESTPTVLINDKKYKGKHNYEDFKKAIEKQL